MTTLTHPTNPVDVVPSAVLNECRSEGERIEVCREYIHELLDASMKIVDDAGDSFTSKQKRDLETIEAKVSAFKTALSAAEANERQTAQLFKNKLDSGEIRLPDGDRFTSSGNVTTLENSHGHRCYALTSRQSLASVPTKNRTEIDCQNPVGEILKCFAGGMNESTPNGIKNLMTESKVGTGGVLVPIDVAAGIVDKARAASVLNNAGMTTMVMDSSETSMAALESDPTFEVKQEGEAFTESEITFGERKLNALTIGTYVKASRELAADAPNFALLVEDALAGALAVEVDRIGIQGPTSGSKPVGLVGNSKINETGSIGAIAWEDVATAALTVRNNNREPGAYICHNTILHDLLMQTSGDGVNSAKNWLVAPPTLDNVSRHSTTNCPLANLIIGDFRYFAFGLRQGVMVEVTTEASDAFAKHQVWFKITLRGDFVVLDSLAFERLAGITS